MALISRSILMTQLERGAAVPFAPKGDPAEIVVIELTEVTLHHRAATATSGQETTLNLKLHGRQTAAVFAAGVAAGFALAKFLL
jgi:hypothetical protein